MSKSTLKEITVDQIMDWKPCGEYTREIVERLWTGHESLTPLEIAALDIPAEDRLWVLLRQEIIPEKKLHLLACDFADDALTFVENPDPRSLAAVQAKRGWIAGKITDSELKAAREAARGATREAAWGAAWGAANEAAWGAANEAAREAAWRAAWGAANEAARGADWEAAREAAWRAAMEAQMKRVISVLEEANDE